MKKHLLLARYSLAALSFIVLSGCGDKSPSKTDKASSMSKTEHTGTPLCSINGETVISEDDFKEKMEQMLKSNPYFKGASADTLPAEIKQRFFKELVNQELIIAHSKESGLENDAEFQKEREKIRALVDASLMVQHFEKGLYEKVSVADSDVAKYFEDNKKRFVKTPGGVLVDGVKFSSATQAQAFLDKAKKDPKNFEKLAQAEKSGSFKSFGRVSAEATGFGGSMVPAPIKEATFAFNSFPTIEKVMVGKDTWVIVGVDKQETAYFDLEEIKPQVSNMLKQNKFKDELDKAIKGLQDSMKVIINEDYFKSTEPKDVPAHDHNHAHGEEAEQPAAAAAA